MFQNRWGALFFVGLTMVGAAALVGTEEESGTLIEAAEQIEQQRAEFDDQAQAFSAPVEPAPVTAPLPEEPEMVEFTSQEDLVIDPSGFDPTPVMQDPAAGEVILVQD